MHTERIGSEGRRIPKIGVGCMGVGGNFTPDFSSDDKWVQTLHFAFDHGMTLVDTAEVYADGHSEDLVGKAIAGRGNDVFVATKVSPEHLAPAKLISSAENSLRRLGIDSIDLYQVHWPNPVFPIEDTMSALESLVESGKVRHVGLCNFTLQQLKNAEACFRMGPIAAAQVEYNLFDRSIEKEYLPYCQKRGIRVIAYSPLDQGQVYGGPLKRTRLEPLAQHRRCSLAQLALAWITSHQGVVAIPKASSTRHLGENAVAGDIELSESEISEINQITTDNTREVPVSRIRAVPDDVGVRKVYRTVEEARDNIYGFSPSPTELAAAIRDGEFLKCVRVRPSTPSSGFDFDLVEGRIRYWAWVIAFNGQRDIPVLVRE